jgi:hypothetical protein
MRDFLPRGDSGELGCYLGPTATSSHYVSTPFTVCSERVFRRIVAVQNVTVKRRVLSGALPARRSCRRADDRGAHAGGEPPDLRRPSSAAAHGCCLSFDGVDNAKFRRRWCRAIGSSSNVTMGRRPGAHRARRSAGRIGARRWWLRPSSSCGGKAADAAGGHPSDARSFILRARFGEATVVGPTSRSAVMCIGAAARFGASSVIDGCDGDRRFHRHCVRSRRSASAPAGSASTVASPTSLVIGASQRFPRVRHRSHRGTSGGEVTTNGGTQTCSWRTRTSRHDCHIVATHCDLRQRCDARRPRDRRGLRHDQRLFGVHQFCAVGSTRSSAATPW